MVLLPFSHGPELCNRNGQLYHHQVTSHYVSQQKAAPARSTAVIVTYKIDSLKRVSKYQYKPLIPAVQFLLASTI